MCGEAVSNNPAAFFLVPDRFKTQDMCIKTLEVDPWSLYDIPDNLKRQEMYDKAIKDDPSSLQFVPDSFVTEEQIDVWFDDDYWQHDDEAIEWYDEYQKCKAQKAKIKDALMPIAWHASRWWDWCFPEDEKKETQKLFLTI